MPKNPLYERSARRGAASRSRARKKTKSREQGPHEPKAKKSLGQHFLTDTAILKKIADAGNVAPGDVVLEIGPGKGSLTAVLLESGAIVIAVEKDEGLIERLKETFAEAAETGRFILIEGDVLDMRGAIEATLGERAPDGAYKIVSNIPYYITGSIIRLIFSFNALPSTVVLLVQDEVARRIVVPEGKKESVLSLSIKAYGSPRRGIKVKAGSFSPAPKVDSAALIVENISRNFFSDIAEDAFFSVIKRSFSQKRKTLLNTLFTENKEKGKFILKKIGLPETVRPETIELSDWKRIIKNVRGT